MTLQLWALNSRLPKPSSWDGEGMLHPKAVLEAVVSFHILVKAKALFLVVLGVPCLVPPLPGI